MVSTPPPVSATPDGTLISDVPDTPVRKARAAVRLDYIDGLRGILALMIAVFHFRKTIMFPGAYVVVDFFFVLSGFILAYVYLPRMGRITLGQYVGGRLARLWPLHIFTLGLYIVFFMAAQWFIFDKFRTHPNYKGNDFAYFVENIFLVQNIGFSDRLTFNYPAWSISVEFWVNVALFFVLAALAARLRPRTDTTPAGLPVRGGAGPLLAGITLVVILAYVLLENAIGNLGGRPAITKQLWGVLNTGLLRGIGGIFLGVLVHRAVITVDRHMDRKIALPLLGLKSVFEVAALAGLLWLIVFQPKDTTDFTAILIFAGLLTSLSIGRGSALRWVLGLRPLAFLGLISYGVYLGHAPLLQVFKHWKRIVPEGWTELHVLGIFVMVTLVLATLLHYFVEKPGQRLFRRLWKSLPDPDRD